MQRSAELLNLPGVWRGRDHRRSRSVEGFSTGHPQLDAQLPDGGWPLGALTEILHTLPGQGEMRLLLPALARLTRQRRHVALIAPPWQPHAPAFAAAGVDLAWLFVVQPRQPVDRLWAVEQTLRSGHCGAVIAWPENDIGNNVLRRLQLAAEAGDSIGFLLRHSRVRQQHSPAALRLRLRPPDRIEIIKCRGRSIGAPIRLQTTGQVTAG